MLQIKNTLGGGKPEGMYVWKKSEIGSELKVLNKSVSTLPYNFYQGSAVVLDGEIHLLGGGSSGKTKHYKWNGLSWVNVSTLPYNFYQGSAVVFDGEIHIFGGYDTGVGLNHYKWNGSSWVSVSTLPYSFYHSSAVVLNNEIHILGSNNSGDTNRHYKFDGTSWTSVSTLPYTFYRGSAVVLDGDIHILGGSGSNTSHYKWDGTSWTSVSTLPYSFSDGSTVVFDNEIHILGGRDNVTKHYKWDGTSWTSVSTLPYYFVNGSAVIYNNGIYILGTENNNYYTAHYLIIGNVPVYTFLDYIVSDKETAYPDGSEKGGYWYEKVVEGLDLSALGFTMCETGEITLASADVKLTINHSLGVEPKAVYIKAKEKLNSTLYEGFVSFNLIAYAFYTYHSNITGDAAGKCGVLSSASTSIVVLNYSNAINLEGTYQYMILA